MFKLATIVGIVLAGAIVTTALAVRTPQVARLASAPQGLIDPTALTLQARNLPTLDVDKAY